MEHPKLCYVEWLDINTDIEGPWCKPEANKPSPCFSFGWLLADTETHITVSATYSDHDDDTDGGRESLTCSSIPRGCITKLEVFTLGALLAQQA